MHSDRKIKERTEKNYFFWEICPLTSNPPLNPFRREKRRFFSIWVQVLCSLKVKYFYTLSIKGGCERTQPRTLRCIQHAMKKKSIFFSEIMKLDFKKHFKNKFVHFRATQFLDPRQGFRGYTNFFHMWHGPLSH